MHAPPDLLHWSNYFCSVYCGAVHDLCNAVRSKATATVSGSMHKLRVTYCLGVSGTADKELAPEQRFPETRKGRFQARPK